MIQWICDFLGIAWQSTNYNYNTQVVNLASALLIVVFVLLLSFLMIAMRKLFRS